MSNATAQTNIQQQTQFLSWVCNKAFGRKLIDLFRSILHQIVSLAYSYLLINNCPLYHIWYTRHISLISMHRTRYTFSSFLNHQSNLGFMKEKYEANANEMSENKHRCLRQTYENALHRQRDNLWVSVEREVEWGGGNGILFFLVKISSFILFLSFKIYSRNH